MLYKIKFLTNNNPYLLWYQSEMKQYWSSEFSRQREQLGRKKMQMLASMGSARSQQR